MNTPLYDELEEKWNAVVMDRRICDAYWRVYSVQTGAEWLEDDEGNEVFQPPALTELNEGVDLTAYIVPNDVKVGDTVTPIKLGEGQPVERIKHKFKLFGRNQGTTGTL